MPEFSTNGVHNKCRYFADVRNAPDFIGYILAITLLPEIYTTVKKKCSVAKTKQKKNKQTWTHFLKTVVWQFEDIKTNKKKHVWVKWSVHTMFGHPCLLTKGFVMTAFNLCSSCSFLWGVFFLTEYSLLVKWTSRTLG